METIKETIYRVMHELGTKQNNSHSDTISAWLQKTLSAKERKHISFYSERKGILSLRVDSSNWIYYLNLKKEVLLTSVRRCLPQVKEIRFYVSEKNEKTQNKRTQAG
jgi:hypothetical protein